MASRYFCGMASRRASSEISTGPLPDSCARTSSAFSPYLDLRDSTNLVYHIYRLTMQTPSEAAGIRKETKQPRGPYSHGMRTYLAGVCLALGLAVVCAGQSNPDFSGTWVL